MSKADELLESMAGEPELYTARPESEPHIVVNEDRTISVPAELRKIAVQYDHNVETVTFDCPRYWDGLDMSQMVIYINYKTPDNKLDAYPAENVLVDETDTSIMHFTWTISRNVTMVQGTISFLICIKKTDAGGNEVNHWNSELCRDLSVSEGMECVQSVLEEYPDVITQLLLRVTALEKNGGGGSGGGGAAIFEGTQAEYEASYAAGAIPVGTIVIITDKTFNNQDKSLLMYMKPNLMISLSGIESANSEYFTLYEYPVKPGAIYSAPYARGYVFRTSKGTFMYSGDYEGRTTASFRAPDEPSSLDGRMVDHLNVCFKYTDISPGMVTIKEVLP